MRILFAVFSGTGNTSKVCSLLADKLRLLGHEVSYMPIVKDSMVDGIDNYDIFVLGFCIHAFNAPTTVSKFLKKLDKRDMPVYIVRISGEPLKLNDAATIVPRRILRKRGFDVYGEFSYVMPYNIIFRHSDGMAARMWQCAELRAERDAKKISEESIITYKVNPLRRFVSFCLRIEHIAMPVIGRSFGTDKKCIGCGVCVEHCPQKNITLSDGKPVFGKNCIGCMACAFNCPQNAVKTSLFNGWKVNGKYSFDGQPAKDDEVCSYCRKSYLRYFRDSETIDTECEEKSRRI